MRVSDALVDGLRTCVRALPFWPSLRPLFVQLGMLSPIQPTPQLAPAPVVVEPPPVPADPPPPMEAPAPIPAPAPDYANPNRPLITGSNPLYLSSVSIKGDDRPFSVLDPVTVRRDGEVHTDIQSLLTPAQIDACVAKDAYPLPATVDREGYHGDRHYDWWLSGLWDYLTIRKRLGAHGADLQACDGVLDLGCASGRLLRHFALQGESFDCWGADINLRNVEWMRMYLPPSLKIFHNTVLPNLPIEDNALGLVTAFSVFTHVDDLELAWMAEIRRILKPGGCFYVTIHSQDTWAWMKAGVPVYDALMQMREHIHDYRVDEAFLAGPMPRPKTVLTWDTGQSYNANVFHHTDYVRREWSRFFEVLEIIPRGSVYQDVVLLRKPLR